jgi:hypothetical protein
MNHAETVGSKERIGHDLKDFHGVFLKRTELIKNSRGSDVLTVVANEDVARCSSA